LDFGLLLFAILLGILQIVRIPISWIQFISPHRAAELAVATPVIGPVSSASLSAVPGASKDALLILAGYVLVYLITADLRRRLRKGYWLLVGPIILIAALEAVLGILQYSGGADAGVGTYVNRNHFAGLLEMSLPLAVMLGVHLLTRETDRGSQAAISPGILASGLFAVSALILVSIVDSHSRMGFLSVLSALLLMGVVGVLRHYSEERAAWRWLAVFGLLATFVLAFVFLSSDKLIGRFSVMTVANELSNDTRREIWHETVPLIKDYAVTGCGLGAYESCFFPYKFVAPGHIVDYAHNDYLQVMAELGVPAFICLLAVFVLDYANALRRTGRSTSSRHLALACAGSLTAILIHSSADFNLYIPANGMLAAWVAGIAREV
jgi:O-antigen ligase